MFGNKLRSWMEAVRPKKRQQRKDKHNKHVTGGGDVTHGTVTVDRLRMTAVSYKMAVSSSASSEMEILDCYQDPVCSKSTETMDRHSGCYSTECGTVGGSTGAAANLSSPESAYSTGYSTDCTSPGTIPPDYYQRSATSTVGPSEHTHRCQTHHKPSTTYSPNTTTTNTNTSTRHTTTTKVKTILKSSLPPTTTITTTVPTFHPHHTAVPVSVPVTPATPRRSPRDVVSNCATLPAGCVPSPVVSTRSTNGSVVTSGTAMVVLSPRDNSRANRLEVRLEEKCLTPLLHRNRMDYDNNAYSLLSNNTTTNNAATLNNNNAAASAVTSPRQRNRIRTNPWLPGAVTSLLTDSCTNPVVHQLVATGFNARATDMPKSILINSPKSTRFSSTVPCSPRSINRITPSKLSKSKTTTSTGKKYSISSSSCSSLSSGTSLNHHHRDHHNNTTWDASLLDNNNSKRKSTAHARRTALSDDEHKTCEHDDEDDDCTLNEMMGKYDESYVYEKETDILSDSDPTDCDEDEEEDEDETGAATDDIDTGQDGGDELDFIDTGSLGEFGGSNEEHLQYSATVNTHHCSYYNFETQRRMSSKQRRTNSTKTHNNNSNSNTSQTVVETIPDASTTTTSRSNSSNRRSPFARKKSTAARATSASSTSAQLQPGLITNTCVEMVRCERPPWFSTDGGNYRNTRSAGTTPLAVRKTRRLESQQHQEDEECGKKVQWLQQQLPQQQRRRRRSNSVSTPKLVSSLSGAALFDQRDKEADRKYKELIVEAEHILMNMRVNSTANANANTTNAAVTNSTSPPSALLTNALGMSPRRVPGPTNKRVEFLRTECAVKQPDTFVKQQQHVVKLTANSDELVVTSTTTCSTTCSSSSSGVVSLQASPVVVIVEPSPVSSSVAKSPSSVVRAGYSPRFSPKRNHITNFMNSNGGAMVAVPKVTTNCAQQQQDNSTTTTTLISTPATASTPSSSTPSNIHNHTNTSTHNTNHYPSHKPLNSPRYAARKYSTTSGGGGRGTAVTSSRDGNNSRRCSTSSSSSQQSADEEDCDINSVTTTRRFFPRRRHSSNRPADCPHSEPVRRKVYGGGNQYRTRGAGDDQSAAFRHTGQGNVSCENLRQEALLHTITSLKRSLVHQSSSLKQVYRQRSPSNTRKYVDRT